MNPLIDMLLLQTFSIIKEHLFRVEFKRRLPKALATILKPKTIEECPGLNNYATNLLIHIQSECLHYMAHDFIKTCSGLIKPATRIFEPREVLIPSANPAIAQEQQIQQKARYEAAEEKATVFPTILCDSLR